MAVTDITARESRIARARAMRQEGMSTVDIARVLDISQPTASAWTKGVCAPIKNARTVRKTQVLPVLERLYREGRSIPEIAGITGVPASTLFDWRRELEVPKNPRSAYVTAELRERISKTASRDPDGRAKLWAAKLYVENLLSTTEIAGVLHVTAPTISDWLRKMNVRVRTEYTLRERERLREANLGEKRWNWKGGITPDRIRLRTSLDMKLARECCFERDNYTCRSCGTRGGKLNAHHIWPFQKFPEWKFEVWNLVTLCKQCHDAFHMAAGGHVRVAIGPFFSEERKTGQVREPFAVAELAFAA
ncbi:MAG TPA: HNH endonuclease [Steroidobacteraceae bacterium]|nr:HNH endonuclease [Steroidobacteraceae bacterium]